MSRSDKAEKLHGEGSSCSQAVFTVFANDFGLDPRLAHRISTGFGGGYGRHQSVCGAVSGAVLALNMAFGSEDGSDTEAKEKCYAAVYSFLSELEEKYGTIDCRTFLKGIDVKTEAGREEVKRLELSRTVCDPLIRFCVELVEKKTGLL